MNSLKNHFIDFYRVLSKQQQEKLTYGINRFITEIPLHYHNVLIGVPQNNEDKCIEEQLEFFKEKRLPFAWYYDTEDPSFKQKLLKHGFQDIGIFQGMAGPLNKPLVPEMAVEETKRLEEFNEVVCTVFDFKGKGKELFKKALEESPLQHYQLRKEGKVVSVLSTYRNNGMVSFWNGATLPEMRRRGFNTALRKWALNEAMKEGCTTGSSFIQSDAMSYGINTRLGYKTGWKFQVLFSPTTPYVY